MVTKGTMIYLSIRYCGKCGERKKYVEGQIYCPDCNNRLRTRPKWFKHKEKYNLSGRY